MFSQGQGLFSALNLVWERMDGRPMQSLCTIPWYSEQVRVWGSALFDLDIWVGWEGETGSNKELKNQLQLA